MTADPALLLREALAEIHEAALPLTRQHEDRIWRPASRIRMLSANALLAIDAAASPPVAQDLHDPERLKNVPEVASALDDYATAIKRWGKEDNDPRRLLAAENVALAAIVRAVLGDRNVRALLGATNGR